ncbi:hypothetical protein DM01DRAFT_1377443 [Hesseltinella vesiculosa]|uniref:Uncharacterized protein n=1 Tax=Hesseltinella vesiculosa TaxID=101127 RepID=A0A1X2G7H8_9FUNG|nr:hypothetical protein DM01DRAFT_1377443 [Hesseltinella vesiculosa]
MKNKLAKRMTPNSSPSNSTHESQGIAPMSANTKFLKDPFRTSRSPDVVGRFVDPMGARTSYHSGYDCTNTGA